MTASGTEAEPETDAEIVWMSTGGTKYHRDPECKQFKSAPDPRRAAVACAWYEPCRWCSSQAGVASEDEDKTQPSQVAPD